MFLLVGLIACFWVSYPGVRSAEQDEHRDFQYNSVVDSQSGRYNFAYDTGNDNEIAHSLHMQYRDANGIVRGRYGYTDPRGKLRMVEYEAGPDGFKARGDVGPDQFPHDQAPDLGPAAPQAYSAAYRQTLSEDLQLVPRPVQMAGWDPLTDPIGTQSPNDPAYPGVYGQPASNPESEIFVAYPAVESDYSSKNTTSVDETTGYGTETESYDDRYPRIVYSSSEADSGSQAQTANFQKPDSERQSESINDAPLNVNNIDVNPDEIREAASSGPVRRSADGDRAQTSAPYSYRKFLRQTHDHDAEVSQASGNYRQTHDHDAEVNYRPRQTHDHAAEMLRHRINHNHAAEVYRNRQTHDHDAELRYRRRQTHDHDAERDYYYRRYYPDRYYSDRNYPRRIFYRDSHSMVPHEHTSNSPVYHNGHYHYLDRYGRYSSYEYPATARPRQLKYVPSDKYHDKYYYWTD